MQVHNYNEIVGSGSLRVTLSAGDRCIQIKFTVNIILYFRKVVL